MNFNQPSKDDRKDNSLEKQETDEEYITEEYFHETKYRELKEDLEETFENSKLLSGAKKFLDDLY